MTDLVGSTSDTTTDISGTNSSELEGIYGEVLNGLTAGRYLHIRYSAVIPTQDSDMTTTPSKYIGLCMTESVTDPTTYTSYTWTQWKGDSGTGATVVQTTGQSTDDVMSQKAVTDELADKVSEPATEGTNGQVLTTDGQGGRTWTTVQGGGGGSGTVTSVSVKMNGTVKGTVTSSGTIDLGTVLTEHQDISGKQDTVTSQTVTIAVADWNSGTTCTKNVTGVTATNIVICDSSDATVSCTAQGAGTLTFTATTTPTSVVTVKVVII